MQCLKNLVKPIEVVNMLQDLFSRFDELCDLHRVQKLETIGDAYICTAGLLDDVDVKDAARNTLFLAKDMVRETRKVLIPSSEKKFLNTPFYENLQIRVGIHVGNVTCGVLGQRLPKFTVFGTLCLKALFCTMIPADNISIISLQGMPSILLPEWSKQVCREKSA